MLSPWNNRFEKRKELLFGSRMVLCYRDRPRSIDEMLKSAVARAPDMEAVVDGDRRVTYAALDDMIDLAAAGLAGRGLGKGDRVALFLPNRLEFIIALFAAVRIGAITVPISIREAAPGVEFILGDCRAKAVIYDIDLEDRLPERDAIPHVSLYVGVGEAASGPELFGNLDRGSSRAPERAVDEEDIAVLLYTSGTTGRPKGAMLSHVNVIHSAMHFQECWEFDQGERSILAVPASHVTGLVAIIACMIRVAGCTILMRGFDAESFIALAAREKMTTTVLVPAMYNIILQRVELSRYDLSAWRIGGFGGAPMPEATIEAMAERLPFLHLLNAYGSTECATIITLVPPGHAVRCLDSVGLCVPCGDLRIVDDEGREVGPGETGEVWIRGPMTISGYWERDEATRSAFVDGYWRSGDIGSLDKENRLRLIDRKNDVINRGGYKIYSIEVENALCRHPGVAEAAVVSHPDPVLGEKVHAFISLKAPDVTADELRHFCWSMLADYKVPDFVTFLDDGLPRNANGKVLKRSLRVG